MGFTSVTQFESLIADFFGSSYAVATDSCTHALELSLRHTNTSHAICPSHTYISVPSTLTKIGIGWNFINTEWRDFYFLTQNVVDAAVLWQEKSYMPGTYMCVSFQYKKHLGLGRAGVILCDSLDDYTTLKKMSYDGRNPDQPWAEQDIDTLGYHYYMTPETAQDGIEKLPAAIEKIPRRWTWRDYPDLRKMSVFCA